MSSLFATISEVERRSFLRFFSINDVSLSIINIYELMNYKIVTLKIENIYKLQKKYIKIHRIILTLLKVCFIYAPLKATKQTVSFDF